MARCLQPSQAARLRKALDDGAIDLDTLASSTSETRRKALGEIITDQEMLLKFNKEFETRIITSARDLSQRKLPFTEEAVAELKRQQSFSKLKAMSATERRATLKQYVDAETSKFLSDAISTGKEADYRRLVDGVFDRKVALLNEKLAKRQRKLLIDFVNREANSIPKKRKKDILDIVSDTKHLMTPNEEQFFLKDLLSLKLGFGVTKETAETIARLADEAEAGMAILRETQGKVLNESRKAFLESPELQARVIKGADKLTDVERAAAAEDFANKVWMGILNPDGTRATKEQFRKVFLQQREWVMKTGELTSYVSKLEEGMDKVTIGQVRDARGYEKVQLTGAILRRSLYEIMAGSKSAAASLDFSYVFRQGWQTALTNPYLLAKNAGLALKDMGRFMATAKRRVGDEDGFVRKIFGEYENGTYDDIRLEIMRRPNAINGKYDAANNGYGLGVFREEQFPTTWPERAPGLLGRVYKMTEIGFNSMALRMRADLADTFIAKMEARGVNVYDKEIADELGLLVGSMTGRGLPFGTSVLEGRESLTKTLNATFFSPRFVGSQFYTIWAPFRVVRDPSNPVLQLAAQKSLQAFGELAGIIFLLNYTKELFGHDGYVDTKVGSSTFGHIVIGDTAFDITGAHGSVITLLGKMWNLRDEGKVWDNKLQIYKDATFGQSVMGTLATFFSYKTSPAAGEVKDWMNGYAFGGEELSAQQSILNIVLPITLTNFYEQANESYIDNGNYADGVLITLAEVVGISSKSMDIKPMSKEWKAIKEYDSGLYNKAVADFNDVLWEEVNELRNNSSFQKLSEEEQAKEIEKMANRIKKRSVDPYLRELPADARP